MFFRDQRDRLVPFASPRHRRGRRCQRGDQKQGKNASARSNEAEYPRDSGRKSHGLGLDGLSDEMKTEGKTQTTLLQFPVVSFKRSTNARSAATIRCGRKSPAASR